MYPVELICNHLESAMFTSKLHFNIYDIWAILSFSTKNWANLQFFFYWDKKRPLQLMDVKIIHYSS